MSGLSRRKLVVAATSATLGAGILASAGPARAACVPATPLTPQICTPDPPVPIPTVVPPIPTAIPTLPTAEQIAAAIAAAQNLNPAQAAALLTQVQAALLSPDPVGGITALATGTPGAGSTTGSAGGSTGSATGTTGTKPGSSGAAAKPGVSTAFRARVTRVKVASTRRTAKVSVACPASAPGCAVALTGKVNSRKAFKTRALAIKPGASAAVKVKLARSAAKRLRAKGGKLKVTATTGYSSLAPSSKTAKVSKPRRRRR